MAYEGQLGEDGPGEGGEVRDRGLFDGYRRGYDEGGYERPPPVYEGPGGGYGAGYGGAPMQPQMPYVEPGYGGGYVGGYGGGGYAADPYAQGGYGQPVGQASDLGTGLMDSHVRREPDYGSSLTTPDMAGVPVGEYGDDAEYDEERRHKRYAEAAAVAALGYGLHERHERKEDDERLEEMGTDPEAGRRHWL